MVLGRTGLLVIAILGMTTVIILPPSQVHSQTDTIYSETYTTLSEDLENDPLAQDILAKIEKTKEWIAGLEEQETKQKEIEEKREEAIASLQKDLKAWQKLWEEFTFDYKFEQQSGIFWDQYNFTKSKITAGREALEKVLAEGGGPEEARSAYVNAAKIKRSELIIANSLINVKHGLAYYNQQILFDSDGQFHDIVSGDQLRKYYQDFRTNPVYLNSNPNDEASWEDLSVSIQSECRDGYVLMHRFQTDDHVCVTEKTSEMWTRHKMGKPMIDYVQPVDAELTLDRFKEDSIKEKVKNINNKLSTTYMYYDEKMRDTEKKYEAKKKDLKRLQLEEERLIASKFDNPDTSQSKLINEIEKMREVYHHLEQAIDKEKHQTFQIMKSNHEQHMRELVSNLEFVSDVEIIWNADESKYEAIRMR